jgi:hypothetical protein
MRGLALVVALVALGGCWSNRAMEDDFHPPYDGPIFTGTACSMEDDPACTTAQYCDTIDMRCVDIPVDATCVTLPAVCTSAQYCDTSDAACVDICPHGRGIIAFTALAIDTVTWTSEVQEEALLGADAAAAGLDDLARDTPYEVRATFSQSNGSNLPMQHLAIIARETTELAHGATLPGAGTYTIGTDPRFHVVATIDGADDTYVGSAGTLSLTAAPSTDRYAGALTGLELVHVDPATGAIAADHCTQTAASVSWSAAPTQVAN